MSIILGQTFPLTEFSPSSKSLVMARKIQEMVSNRHLEYLVENKSLTKGHGFFQTLFTVNYCQCRENDHRSSTLLCHPTLFNFKIDFYKESERKQRKNLHRFHSPHTYPSSRRLRRREVYIVWRNLCFHLDFPVLLHHTANEGFQGQPNSRK